MSIERERYDGPIAFLCDAKGCHEHARLFAAAPDLRNALAEMIEMATHHAMPEDERLIILRSARAAIAKAEGRL